MRQFWLAPKLNEIFLVFAPSFLAGGHLASSGLVREESTIAWQRGIWVGQRLGREHKLCIGGLLYYNAN